MSARRHGAKLILIGALMCAVLPLGPPRASELDDVERALRQDQSRAKALQREAEALASEIQALRVASVSAARKAQDQETRLSAIEGQLAALERQENEKAEVLAARHGQLGQTLAALQRIALQPSDALLLSPSSPIDTVRSGILLRAAIPAIESRAAALRAELSELTALREEIAARRGQLSETARELTGERERLEALIARKSRTRAAATAEQKAAQTRAARLAARAKDLRDLVEKLERAAATRAKQEAEEQAARLAREAREREAAAKRLAESRAAEAAGEQKRAPAADPPRAGAQVALARPPNVRPFPSAGHSLVMPARGKMKTRFGQTQADGRAAHGIVIAARKGAQVVSPYDGKVVYAGDFRSYGQILIIEHGGRYHTLLAGLERIDAVVGQWLLAGEPVGVLGGSRSGRSKLYLELRHAGQPINPLPWLATTGDKVQG